MGGQTLSEILPTQPTPSSLKKDIISLGVWDYMPTLSNSRIITAI